MATVASYTGVVVHAKNGGKEREWNAQEAIPVSLKPQRQVLHELATVPATY